MFWISDDLSLAHGRGKTNRRHIEFPAAHVLRESCHKLFRPHSGPRRKLALVTARPYQFYGRAADIDDENTSLHGQPSPKVFGVNLPVAPAEAAKTLKEALLLWLCCRAGRPAFHYFEGEKSEQQLPGGFQIDPQVLDNLLHRSGTIELRCELGLV